MSNKAQTMKNKSKRTLTPKLRFPEFRDKPGWEEKKLLEISSAIFDGTHQTPTYTEAGIPFYSVENLMSGNANKFISKEDYELATKKNNPEKGDILLTRIGKIGFSQVVTWDHEFSVYVTLAVIKRSSQFNSYYLHCLMQSDFYQSELRSKSLSNAVPPKINMDSLRDTKVLLPTPAEQQKIADCLSSLDELIAAEGRKLEALRAHKKGLMQRLFPGAPASSPAGGKRADGDVGAPSETRPRLRFPEFQNAQSEFMPVGEFAKVTTGNKDTQNKVDDGEYPFFVRSQNVERIDSFSQDCEAILTSGDGVGVGENYHYINGKFDFHQRVYCIYDFNQNVSGEFFFHYFSTHFKKRVKQMSAKNSVDSVRMAMITEMPIWMPLLAEQQRIAASFTSIDDQIATQTQKIAALQTHKKGLMQQLFPSPEEVEA